MRLAIDDFLDRLESEGVGLKPDSDPGAVQRTVQLQDFPLEVRRNAMNAFPAYLSFFCFENAVRSLITERLSENHGPDWWDSCAPTKVQNRVDGRKEKEGVHRWHARRGEHPIYYSDFGDMRSVIIDNWEDFQDLFPDQNWVSQRLEELERSRNIIAHSNVLDRREWDRLRLYLEDWTRQVG